MAVTFFWLRRLRSAIAQNDRMKLRIYLQLVKLKLSQGYGWVTFKTKNSSSTPILMHSGVPDHGTYGFGPSNHHPPTPGAPKDHPSSTKRARYSTRMRKQETLAGSLVFESGYCVWSPTQEWFTWFRGLTLSPSSSRGVQGSNQNPLFPHPGIHQVYYQYIW